MLQAVPPPSSIESERILPHDVVAEQALLGALLINRDVIVSIADRLLARDFFLAAHITIYTAMLDLYTERRPLDVVTLSTKLRQQNALDSAGHTAYLADLAAIAPTSEHAITYADIIIDLAVKRRLIEAGLKIAAYGYDMHRAATDSLTDAEKALAGVTQGQASHGFASVRSIVESLLERLDYIHENRDALVGVPCGFADLNKMTGGLQRSDLIILAARPSMGKTAFALSMCHKIALEHRARVGIFSLEMSKEQLVTRLLCMEGTLDSGRLRAGYINDDEWQRLIRAAATLANTQIFIDDTAGISPMEMRSRARRLQAEEGLDLIVVDYLQLMQGRGSENRVQEISAISRALKALARELNIPVLALSQVSRAVDARTNHVPMLSDLRESGSIEQDADVVMFIYRDEVYNPDTDKKNIADIHIAKHRNGPTGHFSLFFNERQAHFLDLDVTHEAS